MRIGFLHTAQVHVDTFEKIFAERTEEVVLDHVVAPELLDRARVDGLDAVREDFVSALNRLQGADALICTCSTLGPLADEQADPSSPILRIDRPLMEQACRDGDAILVALCLDSTRQPTLDLLHSCARQMGRAVKPIVVMCDEAWALFEAGDQDGYAASICRSIEAAIAKAQAPDCIVLAQASMRVAEDGLAQLGIPVRSSPELAAQSCVQQARENIARSRN